MTRRAHEIARGSVLHDATKIKHHDAVGDVLHNAEVVGDKNQGQAKVALQLPQQVDDLRLDADIQGRDGLVADHQPRPRDQSAGNVDALTLATREFVRIAIHLIGQQAHTLHHRRHPRLHLDARKAAVMGGQRFGNDLPCRHARVQRSQRILKNHLDIAAMTLPVPGSHGQKIPAGPKRLPTRGGHGAHQRAGQR